MESIDGMADLPTRDSSEDRQQRVSLPDEFDQMESSAAFLLRPAARLFRKQGYGSTTTRDIAAAVNMGKASVYHHMESKESLLYEICATSLRNIHAAVSRTRQTGSVEGQVERCIIAHVETMLNDGDMHAAMLTELRSLSGPERHSVVAMRNAYESLWQVLVSEAQQSAILRQDYSPKMLTLALLNLLNWTIFWYDPDGGLSPRQVAGFLSNIYFRGSRYEANGVSYSERRIEPVGTCDVPFEDEAVRAATD